MKPSFTQSADKIVVDRRRKISASARTVRDLRQQITANIGGPIAFEGELMRSFAQNYRNSMVAIPFFVAFVALASGGYVGFFAAGWWFLTALLAYGLFALLCNRYLKDESESQLEETPKPWRRTFTTGLIVISFCWSLYAAYGCATCTDPTYSILQFSVILVFQAITMILSYGFGSCLLVTSAPSTLILSGRYMMTVDPAHMMMAAILIGSQVFFYLIANRFKLSVLSILDHQSRNETLIAELETARSISEEARRRAEEANLAKSRFLATMSHELRTPLNAILGFSEVMQGEVLGPIGNESYKEYINDINDSGKHLLNVINEILDLSRIEAGRQELVEEAIRLDHVAEDAFRMVEIKARNKGVTIVPQFETNLPRIWADERAVRQITLNLLSNAVKFTPNGGTIWLKVGWTSSGGQYLSVRDSGPGIPEEEIPIVLSSFGQGSIAIKSAEQGTGLGLPIVQALMHMHDGKFELRSKLREGTEVIATFPRKRVMEVMPPVQTASKPQRRPSILSMRKAG